MVCSSSGLLRLHLVMRRKKKPLGRLGQVTTDILKVGKYLLRYYVLHSTYLSLPLCPSISRRQSSKALSVPQAQAPAPPCAPHAPR